MFGQGTCAKCDATFVKVRRAQRFCSRACKDGLQGAERTCSHCGGQFIGKAKRKFCSGSCAAKNRIPSLVANNKARRKYEPRDGLTRNQLWYRANHERALEENKDKRYRQKLIEHLGGCCAKCGYSADIRALVLDHIHGDGREDRLRVGNRIARYYVTHFNEAKLRLQVLCANCNQIKSFTDKEHNKSRRIA